MSTARWRLKSPQSLYNTSTHPTMVTHRSQSWSWMIDSHPFHSMSISPPHSSNKAISNFDLETTRSRSWVRSKVKVTYFTQYPTDVPPFHFTSIGPTIPEICPIVFVLEKHIQNFQRKFGKNWVSNKIPPKSNQVISMTKGISLPSSVVIGWVVLTLPCRQANLCLSMSQPWPWVKVTKGSSSTFSQTYTFIVPNI